MVDRDLAPRNILIDQSVPATPRAMVNDFGLARRVQPHQFRQSFANRAFSVMGHECDQDGVYFRSASSCYAVSCNYCATASQASALLLCATVLLPHKLAAVEKLVFGDRQAPENFSMRQLHTFASDVFMLGCTMCAPPCCSQLLFCHYSLSICIVLDMQR